MGMVLSRCGLVEITKKNARREQPHVSRLGEAGWGWYNGADRAGSPPGCSRLLWCSQTLCGPEF